MLFKKVVALVLLDALNLLFSPFFILALNKSLIHVNVGIEPQYTIYESHISNQICGIRNETSGSVRPYRILICISDQYIAVIFNWLAFYNKFCVHRSVLYFLCVDKSTELFMKRYPVTAKCDE